MRRLLNRHMKAWEREIKAGPTGQPMNTVIGQLIKYMQGRSSGIRLPMNSPLHPFADLIRDINQDIEQLLIAYEQAGKINVSGYIEDYFRQLWKNPVQFNQVFGAGKQGS